MRRMFSLQAGRALFGSVPRVLIVLGSLATYYLLAIWLEPIVPWGFVTLLGFLLLIGLIYLGSIWLDRDIMRGANKKSSDEASN